MKALIVDDHQMVREILSRYFAEIDVSVIEAEDFVSAFAAITRQPEFDLILLDIRMPGVDGFTTLATLRRLFPALRIAILSGSVDVMDMRRAAENGAVGYLPKSMDRQPLVNALRLLISGEKFFPANLFEANEKPAYLQELPACNPNGFGTV